MTPLDHLLYGRPRPLEDGLHAAVVEVADPPVHAAFSGGVAGARSVEDALYPPGDEDVRAHAVVGRTHTSPYAFPPEISRGTGRPDARTGIGGI